MDHHHAIYFYSLNIVNLTHLKKKNDYNLDILVWSKYWVKILRDRGFVVIFLSWHWQKSKKTTLNLGLAASFCEGPHGCLATLARAATSAPSEDRLMATSRTAEAAQPHDAARLSFVPKSAVKTAYFKWSQPRHNPHYPPAPPAKGTIKSHRRNAETIIKISLQTDQ